MEVRLDKQILLRQTFDAQRAFYYNLPQLEPGIHHLLWTAHFSEIDLLSCELAVNETVRFRKRSEGRDTLSALTLNAL